MRRKNGGAESRGYPNQWWILAAISLVQFLGTIDGSITNVALPTLSDELGVDFAIVRWVILSYLLGLTVLMVGMGRLADMIGKKIVLSSGLAFFLLGSALCGLAPGIYWLIAFRVIESIGAAMMLSVGIPIITETWPTSRRGMAIGITSGLLSVGIVAGPLMGGAILQWLNWRWIFFVNLPFGFVAALLVWRYVPPLRPATRHRGFDWVGATVLGVSLVSLTVGLTVGETNGFLDPRALLLYALFVLATALFVVVEMRMEHPMVDLSLFRSAEFSLNLSLGWIVFLTLAGFVLLLPFYLQLVLELSQVGMGLMMASVPIAIGLVQPVAGALSDRIGTRPMVLLGMMTLVLGYLAMSTLQADGTPLGFALRLLPVAVGVAAFYSPNNSAIMGATPRKRLGVSGGIVSMVRTLGQVIGIALLGAFFNVRLQAYSGVNTALNDASADAITKAMRDQFWLVAVMMAGGLALALWVWRHDRS